MNAREKAALEALVATWRETETARGFHTSEAACADELSALLQECGQGEAPDGWVIVPREATPAMIAAIAVATWDTASAADIATAREALKTVMLSMQTAPGVTLDDVAMDVATFLPAWRKAIAAAPSPVDMPVVAGGDDGR